MVWEKSQAVFFDMRMRDNISRMRYTACCRRRILFSFMASTVNTSILSPTAVASLLISASLCVTLLCILSVCVVRRQTLNHLHLCYSSSTCSTCTSRLLEQELEVMSSSLPPSSSDTPLVEVIMSTHSLTQSLTHSLTEQHHQSSAVDHQMQSDVVIPVPAEPVPLRNHRVRGETLMRQHTQVTASMNTHTCQKNRR